MADTEPVSVGPLVRYVGEVLRRSHALFGESTDAAGTAATATGARLNDAARPLIAGQRRFASLSGDFATGYDRFTRRAGPALDRLAGLEDRVGAVLTDAAGSDRRGRAQSGAVLDQVVTRTSGAWLLSFSPHWRRARPGSRPGGYEPGPLMRLLGPIVVQVAIEELLHPGAFYQRYAGS